MKKLLVGLCLLHLVSAVNAQIIYPQRANSSGSGNGGGGIKRENQYMTFYSAGFYTQGQFLETHEIPQLEEILDFFLKADLDDTIKRSYMHALLPSRERKYLKVDADRFSQEVKDNLINEYTRVFSINSKDISLFAVTETKSKITYLFPEFFELSEKDQQAILFHEAYWILHPNATYQEVINKEIAFQASVENNSKKRMLDFAHEIGGNASIIQAAINHDLKNNTLKGFIKNKDEINLKDLLGDDWVKCHQRNLGKGCYYLFVENLKELSELYSSSLLLKELYLLSLDEKVQIIFDVQAFVLRKFIYGFFDIRAEHGSVFNFTSAWRDHLNSFDLLNSDVFFSSDSSNNFFSLLSFSSDTQSFQSKRPVTKGSKRFKLLKRDGKKIYSSVFKVVLTK